MMVATVCFFMITVIDDGSDKVFFDDGNVLLDKGSDRVPWQKWITL